MLLTPFSVEIVLLQNRRKINGWNHSPKKKERAPNHGGVHVGKGESFPGWKGNRSRTRPEKRFSLTKAATEGKRGGGGGAYLNGRKRRGNNIPRPTGFYDEKKKRRDLLPTREGGGGRENHISLKA